jgi:hypothetical protein
MKQKDICVLAKDDASHRTKDRIRQHGVPFSPDKPHRKEMIFTLVEHNPSSWLLQAEDGWLGWLPRDEFVHVATCHKCNEPVIQVCMNERCR